jgi:hypothetical protein
MCQRVHADTHSNVDQQLLVEVKLALALLDFGEFSNIEERRFCAILRTQDVIERMTQALANQDLEHQAVIAAARDHLQSRLDRALASHFTECPVFSAPPSASSHPVL